MHKPNTNMYGMLKSHILNLMSHLHNRFVLNKLWRTSQPRNQYRISKMPVTRNRIKLNIIIAFFISGFFIFKFCEIFSCCGRSDIGPSIRYISLCKERQVGNHRTGNHLFMLAAMQYIANLTNRRVAMPSSHWVLDESFDIDVTRVEDFYQNLCPFTTLNLSHYDYDLRFEDDGFIEELRNEPKTLLLCHLTRTYRYAEGFLDMLPNNLKFKSEIDKEADEFLEDVSFSNSTQRRPHRVGVHVRRGDFLDVSNIKFGLTVINASYLKRSFDFYKTRHKNVQFIITSDDFNWTISNLPEEYKTQTSMSNRNSWSPIVLSNHTGAVDLAILTKCDSLIISTGSYGWWAARLANKPTVYYSHWPRRNSSFSTYMNLPNYFPPEWIGLE